MSTRQRLPGDVLSSLLCSSCTHVVGCIEISVLRIQCLPNESWYLVDLEWANTADTELEDFILRVSGLHLRSVAVAVNGHALVIMWQFGGLQRLVEVWGSLDEDGRSYMRMQSNMDPNMRLSAEASLRHAFFA